MAATAPRVSIGISVHNGEAFLADALSSLLAQSFADLELVICDNASTDATPSICRDAAAADERVRYQRNPQKMSSAGNYAQCASLARGEFFRWHCVEDTCLPGFIARCVEALDGDPSVVLVCPRAIVIDSEGNALETRDARPGIDSVLAGRRFAAVIGGAGGQRPLEIYGLMRLSALRHSAPRRALCAADGVSLARLALQGRLIELPQRLLLVRQPNPQAADVQADASCSTIVEFPQWATFKDYWQSVARSSLDIGDRVRCYATVVLRAACGPRRLCGDVLAATKAITANAVTRINRPPLNQIKGVAKQ